MELTLRTFRAIFAYPLRDLLLLTGKPSHRERQDGWIDRSSLRVEEGGGVVLLRVWPWSILILAGPLPELLCAAQEVSRLPSRGAIRAQRTMLGSSLKLNEKPAVNSRWFEQATTNSRH
jgi:hypothetical protein